MRAESYSTEMYLPRMPQLIYIDPHLGWWNLNLIDQSFFPPMPRLLSPCPYVLYPSPIPWFGQLKGVVSFQLRRGISVYAKTLMQVNLIQSLRRYKGVCGRVFGG